MDNHALNYPPELPVCEHRAEILAALKKSPVVIVCGDTGSGKTTQLPKMALETHAHRIAITQPTGDWQWYINGEPELEYFELVPYAG